MRESTRVWPRAAPLALALTLVIPTLTTARAETDTLVSSSSRSADTPRRLSRRFCALGLSIFGMGVELICSGPKGTDVIDTTCQAFERIRWSGRDTAQTIRQAKEHNAAWMAICGRKKHIPRRAP